MDITHAARRFFGGTLLSRISGLLRDIITAYCCGATPLVAAFFVAFRLSHLFRRVFGEGAMHSAFVPTFETIKKDSEKRAVLFYRDLTVHLTLLLIGVIVAAMVGIYWCYPDSSISSLTIVMLPSLLFICLYGVNSSLLNCSNSFFLPGIAPAAFNALWIITLLLSQSWEERAQLNLLAYSVVFGCFLQWLVTFPLAHREISTHLGSFWKGFQFGSEDVKKLARPFSLAVTGIAATQINSAVDPLFARMSEASGPAYLWYAIRMQQLPLALFSLSITSALFPAISAAASDPPTYLNLLRTGIRRALSIIIPSTIALFTLGFEAISLLFGRGEFDTADAIQTNRCLIAYGVGLIPMTLSILLANALHAKGRYKRTALISLGAMVLNIGLNSGFVFYLGWGATSVALATSISAWAQSLALTYSFDKKLFNFRAICLMAVAALLAGLIALATQAYLWPGLIGPSIALVASLFFLTKLFGEEDLLILCRLS